MAKIDEIIAELKEKMVGNGSDSAIFDDVLNDYADMLCELEDLRKMAARVKEDPRQGSLYIRVLSRISQIEKDKRSTLHYLGISPEKGKNEAYEL